MKRGYNLAEAMAYVGVRRRTFNEMWRPRLNPIKEGTSLVFDRRELDELFDALKREAQADSARPARDNAGGNAWPHAKGEKPWATKHAGSNPRKTGPGRSTSTTPASGFIAAASKVMPMRKPG